MPIQFRCRECRQVLSVSSKRAGSEVACPACKARIQVPTVEEVKAALERSASAETQPAPKEDDALESTEASREPQRREAAAVAAATTGGVVEPDMWHTAPKTEDPWSDDFEEEQPLKLQREPIPDSGMDMTPMVDVTFLLLIFFMITASFSLQRSLPSTAPEPEEEGAATQMTLQELEEESVVVTVDENDVIYVDDVVVAGLGDLNGVLAAKASDGQTDLLIEAAYGAKHGTIIAIQDAATSAGMQQPRYTITADE